MRWPPPADWPNLGASRQVLCRPHRWHVQEMGRGRTILMLHGAAGSLHSFRDLIGPLARGNHVVALDLPGHGLTQLGARHRSGLDPMAEDIEALCRQEGWRPSVLVGHSAGAALCLRLARMMRRDRDPIRVVGLNPALAHFRGLAGVLFPAMARMLSVTPGATTLFSGSARNPDRVRALIENTGSTLDARGLDLYRRLLADKAHMDGTLLMMAQWSLDRLMEDLPEIDARSLFLVGEQDRTVSPDVARQAAARMPFAQVETLGGLGHLAHEEAPDLVTTLIGAFAAGMPVSDIAPAG